MATESQVIQLQIGLRLHTEPFILKQCKSRVHLYVKEIHKMIDGIMPIEVINLCFRFYYLNASPLSNKDVDALIHKIDSQRDFSSNTAVLYKTNSIYECETLSRVIEHIERGHKFSMLSAEHLFDVIVFAYLDYDAAKLCKEQGNKYFKKKQYHKALKCYANGAIHIGGDIETNMVHFSSTNYAGKKRGICQHLKLILFNNSAQVYLQQIKFEKAIEKTSVVLAVEPRNEKALIRRGYAHRQIGKLSEARNDVTLALEVASKANSNHVRGIEWELRVLQNAEEREEVRKWLVNEVDLGQYYDCFIKNGYTSMKAVKSITIDDLSTMNIPQVHQIRISSWITVVEWNMF